MWIKAINSRCQTQIISHSIIITIKLMQTPRSRAGSNIFKKKLPSNDQDYQGARVRAERARHPRNGALGIRWARPIHMPIKWTTQAVTWAEEDHMTNLICFNRMILSNSTGRRNRISHQTSRVNLKWDSSSLLIWLTSRKQASRIISRCFLTSSSSRCN